jgi:putative transposase
VLSGLNLHPLQSSLDALDIALVQRCQPVIFNTDQGAQFTASAFTDRLTEAEVQISMDGKGRALDKIGIDFVPGLLITDKV